MFILHDILGKLKNEFVLSRKDDERAEWFIHTLLAIIIPFTSAKTSNLLRCLHHLFGFTHVVSKNDIIRSWPLPNSPGRQQFPALT